MHRCRLRSVSSSRTTESSLSDLIARQFIPEAYGVQYPVYREDCNIGYADGAMFGDTPIGTIISYDKTLKLYEATILIQNVGVHASCAAGTVDIWEVAQYDPSLILVSDSGVDRARIGDLATLCVASYDDADLEQYSCIRSVAGVFVDAAVDAILCKYDRKPADIFGVEMLHGVLKGVMSDPKLFK